MIFFWRPLPPKPDAAAAAAGAPQEKHVPDERRETESDITDTDMGIQTPNSDLKQRQKGGEVQIEKTQ